MRLKFLTVTMSAISLLSAGIATASSMKDERFYVKANLILPTRLQVEDYNSTFKVGGAAAFGWNFHKNFSAEIEGVYLQAPLTVNVVNDIDKQFVGCNRKIESFNGLINMVYHAAPESHFKPFISLGIGIGRHKVTDLKRSNGKTIITASGSTNNNFIYQVGLGMEWAVHKSISVLFDARWLGLGKVKAVFVNREEREKSFNVQALSLGLKFNF